MWEYFDEFQSDEFPFIIVSDSYTSIAELTR